MPTPLSGPGTGLPLPQNLYPSELINAPLDCANNQIALAPGDAMPIPAGDWYVSLGMYCLLQFLDPTNNTWVYGCAGAWQGTVHFVRSDGFNVRVANLTGCPVSATVTSGGASYVQATTTITANVGNSTWTPIIGGGLSSTVTVAGAGYGIAPLVFIPAPPPPNTNPNGVGGIQATGWANISSGTVSTVSLTNQGAGYPQNTTLTVTLVPSPFDPNITTGITNATVLFIPSFSGSLTGALCTNPGAPLTTAQAGTFSLTVAGAGVTASLTPNILQTVLSVSVVGAGAAGGPWIVQTEGGAPATGTISNSPYSQFLAFRPRQVNMILASATANFVGAPVDGGLFFGTPTLNLSPTAAGVLSSVTIATVSLVMGSKPDFVILQPAP